jgi:hypothetical protein
VVARHIFTSLTAIAFSFFLALPAIAAPSAENVEFYAVADRESVPLDETISLTVTLSHDANARSETLLLPEFSPDFQVLSKRQSEQTSFEMSGSGPPSFRKVRVYRFILSPMRTGKLKVPAGKLRLEGKSYETAPIQITVSAAKGGAPDASASGAGKAARSSGRSGSAAPQSPPPPSRGGMGGGLGGLDEFLSADELEELEKFLGMGGGAGRSRRGAEPQDSDIFLRTVLDKKKAYLGEQITMSLLLYARTDVTNVTNMKMPKLDGFWSEDLETPSQISGERRVIDGVAYRVYLLRRKALFPLKSGKLTIDQMEAEISSGIGFFNLSGGRRVQRKSPPVTVEIQPLPLNPPKGFESANVGSWRLSAEASPEKVTLNQPITLRLTLEGRGNLRNIAMPTLPEIPGLRAYEPTSSERLNNSRNLFGGRRTFEYLLMPTKTGTFTLPAIQLPFFDPAQKKYRTAQTSPIQLRVEAGAGGGVPLALGQSAVAGIGHQPADQAVNLLGASGLKPLRYKGVLQRPTTPIHERPWFLPLLLSPFFAWLLLGVVHLGKLAFASDGDQRRTRGAGKRLKQRLRKAEALTKVGDADAFYAAISAAIGAYLTDKLGRPSTGMTRPERHAALLELGASEEAITALEHVLDTCDAGRFAPGGGQRTTMEKICGEALRAMQAIEALKLDDRRQEGAV